MAKRLIEIVFAPIFARRTGPTAGRERLASNGRNRRPPERGTGRGEGGSGGVATIRDVAQAAGVSVATVSRALNGYPDVSDETRRRIVELARRLNYRPSAAARTLVTRRSYLIGVCLFHHPSQPALTHPFFQKVIVGFHRLVEAQGYDILLFAHADAQPEGTGAAAGPDPGPAPVPGGGAPPGTQALDRRPDRLAGAGPRPTVPAPPAAPAHGADAPSAAGPPARAPRPGAGGARGPARGGSRGSYLKRCQQHRVDGVVLMGTDPDAPGIRELAGSGLPCMAVDLDLVGPRAGYVMSDNVGGAALAVRHLFSLGHRRIAIINGEFNTRPGRDRFIGYRQELARLGLPYRTEYVTQGDFYFDSGYRAMERLLSLPEPPTAVFATSDLMAMGAIKAAQERGLRIGRDLAVVGFDDIDLAALVHPALTTVAQDMEGLGVAAARALLRLIDDPAAAPPAITLPVRLVVRQSCGAPAASGNPTAPQA